MEKMIQEVMTAPKEIVFREIDIPTLKDDEVLVNDLQDKPNAIKLRIH